MTANAGTALLKHYVDNSRSLPWRSPPGKAPPDPYRVWLSEIMLQQTTVAAVSPRFERFVERWPTVEALAAAPDNEVLGEWAGLGYYARARNLIACARIVAERGGFPTDSAGLRALPGIGDYTASAIAAIAFGETVVPVDTNVERVIARFSGLARPSRRDVAREALALAPPGRCGDFAQALMDLGATICRPRAPHYEICPIRDGCVARASGNPEVFPDRKPRRPRPLRFGITYWTEREGHVWLVRRPAKGMLGGMPALPGPEWSDRPLGVTNELGVVRHVFTHFELEMRILRGVEEAGDGWWHRLDQLDDAGLPTLYRRCAEAALSNRVSEDDDTRAAA